MERLLTPIVSRLLSRFVKSAAGKDRSDLRASLSGGKVVLYNLELDLMSLFEGLPVLVERAFAKQLTVSIPWTSLGAQPIQVHGVPHQLAGAMEWSCLPRYTLRLKILHACTVYNRSANKMLQTLSLQVMTSLSMVQVHLDTVEVILILRGAPQFEPVSNEIAGLSSGPSSRGMPTLSSLPCSSHLWPHRMSACHYINRH